MAGHPHKHFEKFYWLISAIMLMFVILRCMYVPFSHDEAATFNFYIQPGDFIPFYSHPDANGHFLTSATSWVCFKLFGSSALSLRIPCIIAFIVLCYAVSRINKLFSSLAAKVVFTSAFILSFNFINFYSLCRGYGISMSFLILAMYYFFVHIRYHSFTHLLKFLLFSQLALSANLTLVLVLLVTASVVIIFQLSRGSFFNLKNLGAWLIHFGLIYIWVKYAFYLKEAGALYYGGGESYWHVTFRTLIETTLFESNFANGIVLTMLAIMVVYAVIMFRRQGIGFINNNFTISLLMFASLVAGFYLLKQVFGVNYPEDRTGLFFYVFFMLSLVFMINDSTASMQLIFLYIPLFFISHLALTCNMRVHAWKVYETMPQSFFDTLVSEQKSRKEKITVAGHRVREFFYGFMNYNSTEKLNHMTSPEALQMNCDYALAYKSDAPWYRPYYSEIGNDDDWDFVLLKRKTPIARELITESKPLFYEGEQEYINACELLDTTMAGGPLQASFNISFSLAPVPFNAWLVLQVDGFEEGENLFVRTPLNLVKQDWNNTFNFSTDLVSGNAPARVKRLVAYLWNIDKKPIKFTINSFKLFRLTGPGVTETSKAPL